MENLIKLLHKVGELKRVKRAGWVLKGVPEPESVADHSYRTVFLAMMLAKEAGLDPYKCMRLAEVHDLGECIAGDITPHDNITKEEKHLMEKRAIEELASYNGNKEILELWTEYEEMKTPESKFVHELDKLEMIIQASEYEHMHRDKVNLSEFWKDVDKKIKNPYLRTLYKQLISGA